MSQQERCPPHNEAGEDGRLGRCERGWGKDKAYWHGGLHVQQSDCINFVAWHGERFDNAEPAAKPEPTRMWCVNHSVPTPGCPVCAPASVPDDWILPFELLKRIAKSDRVQAEGGAPEELIEAVLLESGVRPAPASVPQPGESGQDMNAVLDSAELVGDQALRTAIYEFRKRRDRALAAGAGKGSTESEQEG